MYIIFTSHPPHGHDIIGQGTTLSAVVEERCEYLERHPQRRGCVFIARVYCEEEIAQGMCGGKRRG